MKMSFKNIESDLEEGTFRRNGPTHRHHEFLKEFIAKYKTKHARFVAVITAADRVVL